MKRVNFTFVVVILLLMTVTIISIAIPDEEDYAIEDSSPEEYNSQRLYYVKNKSLCPFKHTYLCKSIPHIG
ncbi:hypothetical protein KPH14_010435 [Odynerus spinipes]|uniref:Uncharacterized protein n=1 Tax=Odynerus spinipes TaxID=1348599 RepID=A0AAD9VSZ6_9HYME|nr:hypothetical protein KPH14_010435 [Odynerus spinipes]